MFICDSTRALSLTGVCALLILHVLKTACWPRFKRRARLTGRTATTKTTLLPLSRRPPPQTNLPLAPRPAQPTSTSTPPPLSIPHTHPLFSLLLCAIPSLSLSLSLPTLPQSSHSSSLFSCPPYIPPPLFSLPPRPPEATSPDSTACTSSPAPPQRIPGCYLRSRLLFPLLNLFGPSAGSRPACARRRVTRSPVSCSLPSGSHLEKVSAGGRVFSHDESSAAAAVGPGRPSLCRHTVR